MLRQHHTDFTSNQKGNLSKANDGQTGFVNMRQLVFNKLIRQQACHKRLLATRAKLLPFGQSSSVSHCSLDVVTNGAYSIFYTSLIDCVVKKTFRLHAKISTREPFVHLVPLQRVIKMHVMEALLIYSTVRSIMGT